MPESDSGSPSSSAPRLAITLVIIAGAVLALTGVQQLNSIAGPLLLTINLVIVAYPVQAWLNRKGAPKIVGVVVSGLIVFAILLAFFGALAWALGLLVQTVPQYQNRFLELYHQAMELIARYGFSEGQVLREVQQAVSPSNIAGIAQTALGGITGTLSTFVVTITIIFVVLIDSMNVPRMMQAAGESKPYVASALVDFARGVRRYWIVSSIFGLIVAVFDVIALMVLDVPLALVWGILAFLTNYIPNIGFVLGIVPPTLMALLANDPMTALIVVVAYCVINFVIQSIIMPKFLGNAVGVNATVSLLSLLLWAWVLGPLGALLALPATLFVKTVLIDVDPSARWLNAFIASKPETAAPVDEVDDEQHEAGSTATTPEELEAKREQEQPDSAAT